MGSSHSRLTPDDIPFEVLDYLFLHLEKPSDLLHVGLTAKKCCDVAIPHHIEYRIIRSDCRRTELWEQLIRRPEIAKRFLTLEIIEEGPNYTSIQGPVCYPRSLLSGVSVKAVNDWDPSASARSMPLYKLAQAVSQMSRLARFSYSDFNWAADKVFAALRSADASKPGTGIEEFEALIGHESQGGSVDFKNFPIWKLGNLTRFALAVNHQFSGMSEAKVNRYTVSMVQMLVSECPDLEDLHILQNMVLEDHPQSAIQTLLTAGHWPKLKRVTIENVCLDGGLLDGFFARHPGLESVCVQSRVADPGEDETPDIIFRRQSLRSLRFLHLNWIPKRAEIEDIADSLEGLTVCFSGAPDLDTNRFVALTNILAKKRLRYLVILNYYYLEETAGSLLNLRSTLERLAIREGNDDHPNNISIHDLVTTVIAKLPLLSHLSLIDPDNFELRSFRDCDRDFRVDIRDTFEAASSLQSFEIQLNRSRMGAPFGDDVRCLTRPGAENPSFVPVPYQCWGNFYRGAAKDFLEKQSW